MVYQIEIEKQSYPLEVYRCALDIDKSQLLNKLGASKNVADVFFKLSAATKRNRHANNFEEVWNRTHSGPSRYTDGTYPILYTAASRNVAVTERLYWAVDQISKGKPRRNSTTGPFYLYSCDVFGKFRDYCSCLHSHPNLVHPSDYSFCQNVGRRSLADEVDFIVVPSARIQDGKCIPIFKKESCTPVGAEFEFYLLWRARKKEAIVSEGPTKGRLSVDDVYGSLPKK